MLLRQLPSLRQPSYSCAQQHLRHSSSRTAIVSSRTTRFLSTSGNLSTRRSKQHCSASSRGTTSVAMEVASDMLQFINTSWTQFHAVEEASNRLMKAGFEHIHEKNAWDIKPGGKYFFTRNYSTIVAFAVGDKYQPGNGFYMVGAHTDSPCLKLKPVSKGTKSGFNMVNVETYGGGLWYTWFDRDLSVAGRVLVKSEDGKIAHRLVKIEKPILRIPMLAIHLQRGLYEQGFKPNFQTNMVPILATAIKAKLDKAAADEPAAADFASKHDSLLLQMIADKLGLSSPADIVDFELNVCDVQPGVIGGAKDEFIFCGRLDNLAMSYCALQGLINACEAPDALANETGVRAIALFDHEEVGSDSAQGAGGPVMRDTIKRVAAKLAEGSGQEGCVERALRQSFLVSADMAHALHPNYADKHDPDHQPKFHQGLVLKHNQNQRYATNSISAALFRQIARNHNLPCQEFAVRNDMPCGSTIGPILASSLGCRTLDVGVAQFAMHSIRETCGVDDIDISVKHFTAFFKEFALLDATIDVDQLPPPEILGQLQDVPCEHCGK